jgi:hypothetical protein
VKEFFPTFLNEDIKMVLFKIQGRGGGIYPLLSPIRAPHNNNLNCNQEILPGIL